MNNSSLKLLFIIFLFSYSNISFGQKNIADITRIKGSKNLPIELNLLLQSLQSNDPTSTERLRVSLFNIDRFAQAITREDVFLLGKIEIYRTLLKLPGQTINTPVDGSSLKTLRTSLSKTNDPFFKWILNSLIEDTKILLDSSLFKEYVLQINTNSAENSKYRRIIKKNQLLQKWIQQLYPEAEDFTDRLRKLMLPKMEEALKNIENSYYLLAFQSQLKPLPAPVTDTKDLKFLAMEDVPPAKQPVEPPSAKDKSVEEILNPVLGGTPTDLPLPSNENWLEEENAPLELKNLPKPSNDADWLQDF